MIIKVIWLYSSFLPVPRSVHFSTLIQEWGYSPQSWSYPSVSCSTSENHPIHPPSPGMLPLYLVNNLWVFFSANKYNDLLSIYLCQYITLEGKILGREEGKMYFVLPISLCPKPYTTSFIESDDLKCPKCLQYLPKCSVFTYEISAPSLLPPVMVYFASCKDL